MADNHTVTDAQAIKAARTKLFPIKGVGDFLLRRPNARDIIEIGKALSIITSGLRINDPDANVLAYTEAVLRTIAEQKPKDWDFGADEDNLSAYFEFYQEYANWLEAFRTEQARAS